VITQTKAGPEADAQTENTRSDTQLVRDCLNGQEEAWSELIDKYKNLIFSVPIKYGFSREEATDIFQEVCLELLTQLKNVREPQALAKWLLMVTAHKCFHWKRRNQRMVAMDMPDLELSAEEVPPEALRILAEAEQEQKLREAVGSLSGRCQQLVKMLFFEENPRPYRDVAQTLGIATGSIGFIRQRCLEHLRKKIEGLHLS
jgi:RNA polymerase sigma factor (sigma-70 family)